ncbi:MAG: phosphoribosylamine--glycine ligase [Planctomycetota bacterium]|nr:phosphoribosylamine--glycine ligase [Planctomycetota bacterium]MEC8338316.1 phosphoribosylamine--glycine ligase [Planctomycetota bacterium]
MNILVVGSGGREHALAWKLAQSPRADRVWVAPGNAGTQLDAENVDLGIDDFEQIVQFAKQNAVGLTVVGPEAPLAGGLINALDEAGIPAFGPSKDAAQLEASKVFCKQILRRADVPTAEHRAFQDADSAVFYLQQQEDRPWVVKADGLAAGKGVIVCENREEAIEAVQRIARDRAFGEAGDSMVIEERLYGQEASILAITDGRTLVTLPAAQDHKPALDGDTGPNTGGMGAYSPTPLIDAAAQAKVEEEILVPTVHALKRSRQPFQGVLYAGLIVTNQGIKVLEYNVRFGDPECQPLMMRLSSDLLDLFEATVKGDLASIDAPTWDPRPSVCVVMASEGYPGDYVKGHPIRGLDEAAQLPDVKVFHAGTRELDGEIVTSGGRVLGVTAVADTVAGAKLQAYRAVKCIRWKGAWCRKDISDKAIHP